MTQQQIRSWLALCLASLLALPTLVFAAPSPSRRAQAKATYERAVELETALKAKPEADRRKQDYEKVRRAFHEVYRLDPAFSKAPLSLAAIGELYEEMARVFSSERYYSASVDAYQFLASQYPGNPRAREALFRAAEIYERELDSPEEARTAYQNFLKQYPKSEKATKARERLRAIHASGPEAASARVAAPRSTPEDEDTKRAAREKSASGGENTADRAASRAGAPVQEEQTTRPSTPTLTTVRHWVGPNYSRIVIGVEDEVKFDTSRLANPDRIVLDLANTRLGPALTGKSFPVGDGYLRQIRVAQFKPKVTRVVLDVEKIEDYSVFSLPNPFRLVVDIHGTAPQVATKIAPGSAAPTGSAAPAKTNPPGAGTSTGTVALGPTSATRQPESAAKEGVSKTSSQKTRANTPDQSRQVETPIKPSTPTESGSRTLTRALGLKVAKIVIDPGHGGHDTGTIGPGGLREKELVLDVGLRLKKLVERDLGSRVVMTRDDDTFIPLEERTAIANQNAADLFISVHANASHDRSARGIETYYLNFTSNPEALEVAARENATSQESVHQLQDLIKKIAMTEKIEESHEFAKEVQREVHTRLAQGGDKLRNRGVKKAPFVVLIGANMPSILTEISFITNPRDERLLRRPEYRQKIAAALYQGLMRYMSSLGGVKVAQKTRLRGPAAALASPQVNPSPADRPDF